MATAGKMIGPLFGGVIFDAFNMSMLCYLLIALLLFSMCTTWIYDYKLKEKRQRSLTISK